MKQIIAFVILLCACDAQSQGIGNNMFNLSVNNLRLENEVEGGYGGVLLFNKDSVFLDIAIEKLNARSKRLTLSFSVMRKRDTVNIYPDFYKFEIKKKGWETDTIENVVAYNNYLAARDTLKQQLKQLRDELELIDVNDIDAIREKQEQIGEKRSELDALQEVIPVYVFDGPFDNVVFVYVNNGVLTSAGRDWVKTLPFNKNTFGKFVQ